MTGTVAVGYEFVYAIARESYVVAEDAREVAYAFEMNDETRRRLTACVEEVLDHPETVDLLELEPGYVRVRVDPSGVMDPPAPKAYHEALRRVPAVYNERYATGRDLDGLEFGDSYAGLYHPDDADSLAADTGEPLFEIDGGENAYPGEGMDYRCRFRVAFEPLSWDEHERERIRKRIAGRRHNWPGHLERFELYPDHAVAVCSDIGQAASPDGLADGVRRAFDMWNRGSQFYENDRGYEERFAELELRGTPDVEAVEPAEGADAWIDEHTLDLDGEPIEPDPEPATDAGGGDGWASRINPFGGST